MNFSAILDISSFFIGMIINLLLIALICYYFKRKYENLEIAQNEQAKVLYQLLQQNAPQPKVKTLNEMFNMSKEAVSDSESETDCDSDSESDSDESEKDVKTSVTKVINLDSEKIQLNESELNEILNDIEEINVDKRDTINIDVKKTLAEPVSESDYSKMTIKQLKEILSVKGINPTKLKKNEMIELIEKSSNQIDKVEKIDKLDISIEKSFINIDE
jgi:hypothetical protein